MNDDFLYNNRPPVRKAFSDSLYQRLSRQYPDNHIQRKGIEVMINSFIRAFKWKYALLALVVIAALLFTFSEPVRAKTLELIRSIAGFNIEEQGESPIKEIAKGEGSTESADPESTVIEPTVYSVPTFTLPEALKNPPFQFGLPTWIPEGYVLDQNVGIANSKSWVALKWSNSNSSEIQMLVEQEYSGYNLPAGENSSEETMVNGQPALLVRGFWDHQGQWDPKRGITIGWIKDGHFYRLNYDEREPSHNEIKPIEGDMEAIIKELIQMAESIP